MDVIILFWVSVGDRCYFEIMNSFPQKLYVLFSIVALIIIGHYLAEYFGGVTKFAWIYVALFYGVWIILSLLLLLKVSDLKPMLKRGTTSYFTLLPFLFIIPTFIFIFLPNIHLLKPDGWLMANIFICIVNPWLEEIYWRGLISKTFNDNLIASFIISSVGFAISHPLIFGVNSRGVSGILALAGTFVVGAIWWLCYHKTKSLRGNIFTHFLMDVAGMSVYILANKATLFPLI